MNPKTLTCPKSTLLLFFLYFLKYIRGLCKSLPTFFSYHPALLTILLVLLLLFGSFFCRPTATATSFILQSQKNKPCHANNVPIPFLEAFLLALQLVAFLHPDNALPSQFGHGPIQIVCESAKFGIGFAAKSANCVPS